MKNAKTTAIVLSIAALGAASALIIQRTDQPVYKGKRLGMYLHHFGQTGERHDADIEAFVHFGTNAVPYLREALRAKDSPARRMLRWLAANQSLIKIEPPRSAAEIHLAALNAYSAMLQGVYDGLTELSAAEACQSEIKSLVGSADPLVRMESSHVLSGIAFVRSNADYNIRTWSK